MERKRNVRRDAVDRVIKLTVNQLRKLSVSQAQMILRDSRVYRQTVREMLAAMLEIKKEEVSSYE